MSRFVYNILITTLLPLALLRLCWRSRHDGRYLKHWSERLALRRLPKATLWIHAVSVGEVHIITHMLTHWADLPKTLITCTTPTGRSRITHWLANHPDAPVQCAYLPYDQPLLISKAIAQVQPIMLILVETEIWTNLIHYAKKRSATVALINARMSQKSAARYRSFAWLAQPVFRQLDLVLAQSKADSRRLRALGADTENSVSGNMKYDFSVSVDNKKLARLRAAVGKRHVWTIGSSRMGEHQALFRAVDALLQRYPDTLICWAPRHIAMCASHIVQTARKKGYSSTMFSSGDVSGNILVVDTYGELPLFYAVADIIFIGGSLVDTGSQNLIEPSLLGKPVISGPSHFNFAQAHQLLKKHDALTVVKNANELAEKLLYLIDNWQLRSALGAKSKKLIRMQQGATQKNITYIQKRIHGLHQSAT